MRNLTFPNPSAIDLPDLYRSYSDYLRISYDLVRRGVRFGNNNWTPVRARSFAEPVERLIAVTSEQLHEIYNRGLYSADETLTVDEAAHQVEMQNLLARIDLPMARVEIRTDDGGQPLELDIANLTLKHFCCLTSTPTRTSHGASATTGRTSTGRGGTSRTLPAWVCEPRSITRSAASRWVCGNS